MRRRPVRPSRTGPGKHDPDYVDAFYGPAEWKTQAEKEKKSLDAIGAEAAGLSATLGENSRRSNVGDDVLKLRREYLQKQIAALAARVRMLKGEKLKFDDESRALYDAVAPTYRRPARTRIRTSTDHFPTGKENPRHRSTVATLRRMAKAVHDPEGEAQYRVSSSQSRNAVPGRWRTLRFRLTRVSPSRT